MEPEPKPSEVEHIKSIPWCAAHLTAADLVVEPATTRTRRPNTTMDIFISATVNTPDTIKAWVTAHRPSTRADELRAFVTLGTQLDGYAGVCHGGVVAVIFDETLGMLSMANAPRGLAHGGYMTAYLNTTFKGPVRTPGTYMLVVEVARRQGRKLFMTARWEDERGAELARAEALFVAMTSKI